MHSEKYKFYFVNYDLEGQEKDGKKSRLFSGFLTYDGKPMTEVIASLRLNPGSKTLEDGTVIDKKPWFVINESVAKDERIQLEEQGLEPENFGWGSLTEAVVKGELKHSIKVIQANVYGLSFPLAGWINRKTVEGKDGEKKEVDTLCLSFSDSDLEFWEDKVENPYILEDNETPEAEWNAAVDELAKDYPGFQNFVAKYFPSSRTVNANKRRDLLSKLRKKGTAKPKGERF